MTIDDLFAKVPWTEMEQEGSYGLIRSRINGACPICAAFGLDEDDNDNAVDIAFEEGMGSDDADAVVNAADGLGGDAGLRQRMLALIEAARMES